MRGGIPLYPRSAKQRKRRTPQKIGLRILQSGMAVSVLLLYTSNQVGSTYGDFKTSKSLGSSIELCSVFPAQIKQLLLEFSGHIHKIMELKSSLRSYPATTGFNTSANVEAMSLDELDHTSSNISEQISALNPQISALEQQLSFNAAIWLEIAQEAGSAAAILSQIGAYMGSLSPNCLEIRDPQFFQEFQNTINQSGVLSEPLVQTLNGIRDFLISLRELDDSIPLGASGGMDQQPNNSGFLTQQTFLSFMGRTDTSGTNLSAGLLSTYEQLNTELSDSLVTLTTEIANLQNLQTQIADTKARLLEQAKKEEAERLELEKKEQEEAAAAKAEEEVKEETKEELKEETEKAPPAEESAPAENDDLNKVKEPEKVPAPEPVPTDEILKEEPVKEIPPAEETAPLPSLTPAPLPDSDPNKGGD